MQQHCSRERWARPHAELLRMERASVGDYDPIYFSVSRRAQVSRPAAELQNRLRTYLDTL
ncbi:MAG: hypothetical protein ACWGPN_15220 [Gammaproteobacteria bacterium]